MESDEWVSDGGDGWMWSNEKTTTADKADAAEADADRCHAAGHTPKSGSHAHTHNT